MRRRGGGRLLRKTTCPFDCWDACGALAEVTPVPAAPGGPGAARVRLRGDPDHPFSRGTICGKLAGYPAFLESPARVRRPLLREGSRWREVSWDEALDLCARRLEEAVRAGPDLVLYDLGNGNCGLLRFSGQRFFRLLGADVTTGSLCDVAGEKGLVRTAGACLSHPPADVLNSRAVVLWGRNPAATNLHFWRFVCEARRRGAAVAVVDVYPSATARRADLFLCLRPGTDVHLALGVARALLDAGRLDRRFLEEHTAGVGPFLELVSTLTVEEAARTCGVEPEQVRRLADLLARRPASLWLGMGMQHYRWGPTAAAFVAALGALTGQYGVPGGGVSFFTPSVTPFRLDWAEPDPLPGLARPARTVRKPVLAADLLAGPAHRVAWFQGSNIARQAPDAEASTRALARIAFKVAVEVRMSETARLCDLVLPAASSLEQEDVRGSFGTPWVGYMAALVPPPPGCLPEAEIYAALARRLGFEREYLAGGGPEGWLRRSLSPLEGAGITLELLRDRGGAVAAGTEHAYPHLPFAGGRFATPDGRFHFPGPGDFRRYLDLRSDWQAEVDPALYPLHLITPKSADRINSHAPARPPSGGTAPGAGTGTAGGAEAGPPAARVHPCHLPAGGGEAFLVTPLGKARVRLIADGTMKPGVVVVGQGDPVPGLAGINALVPASLSEDGEGACYYEARCRLEGGA